MEVSSQTGSIILDNRYVLLECLAVSGIGKIYRGRDLEQVKAQGKESCILVHVLPAVTPALPLDSMFQHMSEARQRIAAPWILAPLTYGQDEGTAYFILESPDKWGLRSLSTQADANNPFWRSAMHQLQPLVKQGYLETQTDPALLLGLAKLEVFLLATALSPQIQRLQSHPVIRSVTPRKSQRVAVAGSLLALSVCSAVAASAILKQSTVAVPPPPAPFATQASTPKVRLAAIPMTEITADVPADGWYAGKAQHTENIALPEPAPKASSKLTETTAVTDKTRKPAIQPEPEVQSPPPAAIQAATVATVATTPVTEQAAPTGVDGLIQQAYAAMQDGHLGDSNGGALAFTRQLRGQSPQHPQVARLGQEIAAAYLRQIRGALQADNLTAAGRLLPTTRQLIDEFGLNNLEPAQQVLEQRVAQLNSY